jgi:hypothetical protein
LIAIGGLGTRTDKLSSSDISVLRQVAAGFADTGIPIRVAQLVLRNCVKDSGLIPLGGLAILSAPEDIRASTSAAGEEKNDNQES